jgi:hypothetical protein
VKQVGLQPFDLRLDAMPVGQDYHGALTVHGPGGGSTRDRIYIFDFQQVIDLSGAVFRRVGELVNAGEFSRASLADASLVSLLNRLNLSLYGIRVAEDGRTLRDVMMRVLSGPSLPTMIVSGAMRMIPWELTSPERSSDSGEMLGGRMHIVGSTDPEVRLNSLGGRAGYRPKPRTNVLAIPNPIRLRAIGNTALDGAAAEALLVKAPNMMTTGSIAPELVRGGPKDPLFSHFGPLGYDLVHVFAHCDYEGREFRLRVSDSVDLSRTDFFEHEAAFPTNAFHFLNVCNGAPNPDNRTFSLLDYLAKQHYAGGVLASLTPVRSTAAVAMASAFYAGFLPQSNQHPGRSAADALMAARLELWDQDLAAGYLYRTYGRQDVTLQPVDKILETANV